MNPLKHKYSLGCFWHRCNEMRWQSSQCINLCNLLLKLLFLYYLLPVLHQLWEIIWKIDEKYIFLAFPPKDFDLAAWDKVGKFVFSQRTFWINVILEILANTTKKLSRSHKYWKEETKTSIVCRHDHLHK